MVQVTSRSSYGSIKYCRIHDLLRDLAIQKAKEDNFLIVYSNPDDQHNLCMACRVAVHHSDCGELVMSQNLRTLLCFRTRCMPNCSKQRMLKVVSIEGYDYTEIKLEILEGLTQLRYFNFIGSLIPSRKNRSLKEVIGNMKFLQTVSDNSWYDHELRLLGHEALRHVTGFPVELLLSTKIPNLQTLDNVFNEGSWTIDELPHAPYLRTLYLKHLSSSWGETSAFLSTLNHLISLNLTSSCLPFNGKLDMRDFPFYLNLRHLELDSSSDEWTEMTPDMPPHLTCLLLFKLKFRQDIMPVLEKLQCLKKLKLYEVDTNEKMCCSSKGFRQLEVLSIEYHSNLKDLEIEQGAMPNLRELEIFATPHLRVPQGLRHLTNLQQLKWYGLYDDPNHAAKANEIHNLCKHVPSVMDSS